MENRKITEDEKHISGREKILVDIRELAQLLSIPVSTAYEFNYTGKLPLPIKLGKGLRWRKSEIQDWINQDCPGRQKWESMRN